MSIFIREHHTISMRLLMLQRKILRQARKTIILSSRGRKITILAPRTRSSLMSQKTKFDYQYMFTNYYRTPDPDLGDITPRQYFRAEEFTFEQRYQFGLKLLQSLGITK